MTAPPVDVVACCDKGPIPPPAGQLENEQTAKEWRAAARVAFTWNCMALIGAQNADDAIQAANNFDFPLSLPDYFSKEPDALGQRKQSQASFRDIRKDVTNILSPE